MFVWFKEQFVMWPLSSDNFKNSINSRYIHFISQPSPKSTLLIEGSQAHKDQSFHICVPCFHPKCITNLNQQPTTTNIKSCIVKSIAHFRWPVNFIKSNKQLKRLIWRNS